MRINRVNTNNNPKFGALIVSPKYMDELHTTVFKNKQNIIKEFDDIVDTLKEAQKANPRCNIELFQGVNPFTGDTRPTMHFVDKFGSVIAQISTNRPKYNTLSEGGSLVQMCADACDIANNIGYHFDEIFKNGLIK